MKSLETRLFLGYIQGKVPKAFNCLLAQSLNLDSSKVPSKGSPVDRGSPILPLGVRVGSKADQEPVGMEKRRKKIGQR